MWFGSVARSDERFEGKPLPHVWRRKVIDEFGRWVKVARFSWAAIMGCWRWWLFALLQEGWMLDVVISLPDIKGSLYFLPFQLSPRQPVSFSEMDAKQETVDAICKPRWSLGGCILENRLLLHNNNNKILHPL